MNTLNKIFSFTPNKGWQEEDVLTFTVTDFKSPVSAFFLLIFTPQGQRLLKSSDLTVPVRYAYTTLLRQVVSDMPAITNGELNKAIGFERAQRVLYRDLFSAGFSANLTGIGNQDITITPANRDVSVTEFVDNLLLLINGVIVSPDNLTPTAVTFLNKASLLSDLNRSCLSLLDFSAVGGYSLIKLSATNTTIQKFTSEYKRLAINDSAINKRNTQAFLVLNGKLIFKPLDLMYGGAKEVIISIPYVRELECTEARGLTKGYKLPNSLSMYDVNLATINASIDGLFSNSFILFINNPFIAVNVDDVVKDGFGRIGGVNNGNIVINDNGLITDYACVDPYTTFIPLIKRMKSFSATIPEPSLPAVSLTGALKEEEIFRQVNVYSLY